MSISYVLQSFLMINQSHKWQEYILPTWLKHSYKQKNIFILHAVLTIFVKLLKYTLSC